MLQPVEANFTSMSVVPRPMDVRPQEVPPPPLTLKVSGGRAHRVAQGRLLSSAVAHGVSLAILMVAAALGMLPALYVLGATLALVVAHGLLWMQAGRMRPTLRQDPAMNVPLSLIALVAAIGLALASGAHRVETLAAAAPCLILASCHLKRPSAAWIVASCLAMSGLVWMSLSHTGLNVHAMASAWLALVTLWGIGMHSGAGGFAKRLRPSVIDTWIRSADRQQREFMLRYLVGAFNCVVGVTVLNLGLHYGICHEPQVVQWLTCLAAVVIALFYGILRSGLNRRFSDPSMTEYQILAAVSFLAMGYWLASTRGEGVAMVMLVIILMFGMFSTTPAKIGRCSVYGLLTFGMAMLAVGMNDTEPGTAVLQSIHLAVLIVVLPTIYILASQLALLRARLRQRKEALAEALVRIEALATRDELTGLPNRRDMLAQLAVQQQRAKRSGKSFCLCMVDIDHFKKINDVHGHGVGDDVLRAFASAAKASLRDTDVIARWGGEEFLVMLPDTDHDVARLAIERMHMAIGASRSMGMPQLAVTFSAGLVSCEPQEPCSLAIERADRALYQAKSEGRNRTVMA
jgi:diguanylate cyclase (GGDEF)-like protein